MMDEAGVDRAVIVPPSWPGDRNDYALEAVKRYPTRFRVMGKVPLQDPKSLDLLPKWKEQPGMVGVRVIFNNAQTTLAMWRNDYNTIWPHSGVGNLPRSPVTQRDGALRYTDGSAARCFAEPTRLKSTWDSTHHWMSIGAQVTCASRLAAVDSIVDCSPSAVCMTVSVHFS